MKPAAWRLTVTAVLFAAWIGYLGYLVAETRNPIVLSRPQFLISSLDVVATRSGDNSVLVDEVLYPANKKEEWQGKTIQLYVHSKLPGGKEGKEPALTGSKPVLMDQGRKYLLPLDIEKGANAWIVPTPPSPGYKEGPPRIYPFDAAVLSEYRTIPK